MLCVSGCCRSAGSDSNVIHTGIRKGNWFLLIADTVLPSPPMSASYSDAKTTYLYQVEETNHYMINIYDKPIRIQTDFDGTLP